MFLAEQSRYLQISTEFTICCFFYLSVPYHLNCMHMICFAYITVAYGNGKRERHTHTHSEKVRQSFVFLFAHLSTCLPWLAFNISVWTFFFLFVWFSLENLYFSISFYFKLTVSFSQLSCCCSSLSIFLSFRLLKSITYNTCLYEYFVFVSLYVLSLTLTICSSCFFRLNRL